MAHPEEFGEIFHCDNTGFKRRFYVWAEIDPDTYEILLVFVSISNMSGPPTEGYSPTQCTTGVTWAALKHVETCIKAFREVEDMEEDVILIDDGDVPALWPRLVQ